MWSRAQSFIDRLLDLQDGCEGEAALLNERFLSLQRQIPWLYGLLLANITGLSISLRDEANSVLNAANFLALMIVGRLVYWIRIRNRVLQQDRVKSELRKTFIVTALLCAAYCWWSLARYHAGDEEARVHIVLFASLAAIGCSFGLSAFVAASRLPLLLIALPISLELLSDGEIAHVGMGASLVLLILLTIRLTSLQNERFTLLVHSRFDVELERRRATVAEATANEEKSRAREIANTDALTSVPNRRAFLASLEALTQTDQSSIAVAILDLDGFKPINDTFGHETGDQVLIEVSARLKQIVTHGSVARLGGDEFALLIPCNDGAEAVAVCEQAIGRISEQFVFGRRRLSLSAAAGVCFTATDAREIAQSLRRADIALYQAKRAGRGQVQLFVEGMDADLQRRTSIEQALREPGVQNGIDLAFQPIVDLRTQELQSFEALARWRHSEFGWISPGEFIPITERISGIEQISDALLARAVAQAARWPASVHLSFNLSAVELCSANSAEKILRIITQGGLDPVRLQVEVTETAFLTDFEMARSNLAQLRSHGIKIVLDDFGSGFASISYLREMAFDAVKLDGSLIISAGKGAGLPLLTGVLSLCEAVGLPCIAEHVENRSHLEMLQGLNCRYGQGYGLGRPMGADAAEHFAWSAPARVKDLFQQVAA